ncbi:hypothetical protein EHI47_38775 [Rhizobium leguminosarum]|uniref:Uncharacterized protein n=1 Tax=Rhizobium leguminosarum TaxID=384 RepID=A0A444HHE8_RHILE|nr:hypothetical protein EHI47_38775 [Rhizobium leguminosarum]
MTTNTSELPINAVTRNKPNVLIGLNQKVCSKVWSFPVGPPWTESCRRIGRVRLALRFMRNRVSP